MRAKMQDEDDGGSEEASVPMTCEMHAEGGRQKSCQRLVDAEEGVEAGGPRKMKLATP